MTTTTRTEAVTGPSDIELAAQLVYLEEHAERLDQQIKDLKAVLAERHPDKGDYPAGDYKIRVSVTQRLNAKKIEMEFPVEQYRDVIYKDAVDTDKFKAFVLLSKKDLASYQTASSPSVKVL